MPVSATWRTSIKLPDLGTSLHSAGAAPSRILFKTLFCVSSRGIGTGSGVEGWFVRPLQRQMASDIVITVVRLNNKNVKNPKCISLKFHGYNQIT